jgi:hypothetical protein
MKDLRKSFRATSVATSALVLAAVSAVYGAEPVATTPAAPAAAAKPVKTGADKFFTEDLIGAFKNGKFNLNERLRYEYADQDNLRPSNAFTLSSKFGFTTAPLYGFQAMVEGENVTSFGNDNNYNDASGNGAGRTPIPDPEMTTINQYWLSYTKWDTLIKGPRQTINLDNQRFIGSPAFRQNDQTFDSLYVQNKSIKDTTLNFGYLYQINRVLGPDNPAGVWNSQSFLFNGTWKGNHYANITPYVYLLDFEDSSPANSSASYGAALTGKADLSENADLNYRAEFAWQSDYGTNPNSYSAPYYHFAVDSTIQKRWNVGVGYEVLASDDNFSFQTPLATLHKFNGWADRFLVTPAQGLQDLYAQAGVKLPYEIPLKFIYHKFDSNKQDINYGQEFDVEISKKFYERFTAVVAYAYFDGQTAGYPDSQRVWVSLGFVY